MARSSPAKIAEVRRLLLPLVSAQDFEASFIATTAMQGAPGSTGTTSSISSGRAHRGLQGFFKPWLLS
jgi:hypothetical protein